MESSVPKVHLLIGTNLSVLWQRLVVNCIQFQRRLYLTLYIWKPLLLFLFKHIDLTLVFNRIRAPITLLWTHKTHIKTQWTIFINLRTQGTFFLTWGSHRLLHELYPLPEIFLRVTCIVPTILCYFLPRDLSHSIFPEFRSSSSHFFLYKALSLSLLATVSSGIPFPKIVQRGRSNLLNELKCYNYGLNGLRFSKHILRWD